MAITIFPPPKRINIKANFARQVLNLSYNLYYALPRFTIFLHRPHPYHKFFNLSQKIVKDLLLRPKPLPVLFISFERGFILAIIAICLWLSILSPLDIIQFFSLPMNSRKMELWTLLVR